MTPAISRNFLTILLLTGGAGAATARQPALLAPLAAQAQTAVVEIAEKQDQPGEAGESPAAPQPQATGETPATPETPPKPTMLESFRKVSFSRAAAVTLREWAGTPPGPDASQTPQQPVQISPTAAAQAPDPNLPVVEALRKDVALGKWASIGAFFGEHFKDKPEEAKQAYQHILATIGGPPGQPGMPVQQPRGPVPPGFMDTGILNPDDVLRLADQCPCELDPDTLQKLGALLAEAARRGSEMLDALKTLDAGTAKLGGTDKTKRRDAARLLIAANLRPEAERFLPSPDQALEEKDIVSLNLLAVSAEGKFENEGKPEHLEHAWMVTQKALSIPEADPKERAEALRRAVGLAPRVRVEFGGKWLAESFTSRPELGMEILAGIGSATVQSRRNRDAEFRRSNLELQHRAVEALLKAAPQRAVEWSQTLTLLAMNWLVEARWTQQRDTSVTRGPQMQYDMYGNVFFYDSGMNQNMGRNPEEPMPIPTGAMLEIVPGDAWLEALEPSIRPAFLTQIAELHLKVKSEKDAFPYIEKLAAGNPGAARDLAERFIEVWGENHDPNANSRRTNRYMYIYGYNPQADGIPLTRSRQERNLEELAGWVKRLRALPLGGKELDEEKIAHAFTRTHSSAEVYRLENIVKVFGGVEGLKPDTLASILETMRQNLATVWRDARVQQENKTKRTDKEMMAEVFRGYATANAILTAALQRHPDNWRLQLSRAAFLIDESTLRNEQQKDSSFAAARQAAFAEFQKAADLYAKALPSMELRDQSVDIYTTWFYASLGASDLEGVKAEHTPAPGESERIRAAILALPGEAAKRHETMFANALATRMSAAAPAVKHRYLSQGLAIAGDNERAREARDLFDYYADLVTEIRLDARIDGPDTVGTEPFGVFVDIRHTKQIEREAGGFQKYLQNQNSQPGFYNFGRPPENYRDKFEEAARATLGESFEVLSVTFHTDKIQSRGDAEDGWRVTPYCYLLLKAKGPQTDVFPPLKLNLDFLDTSGYAVLPIESARLPLDASKPAAPRPMRKLEVQQILDERKADEGVLGLEIKATARGLVPELDRILDLNPAEFDIEKIEDQGVRVTQLDAGGIDPAQPASAVPNGEEDEDLTGSAISERLWNITLRAKKDLRAPAKTFTFAAPKMEDMKVTHYRYADADLQEVPGEVSLEAAYGEPASSWKRVVLWTLGALAVVCAGLIFARKQLGRRAAETTPEFQIPEEITPLTVLSLLRRIRVSGKLPPDSGAELDRALAGMESACYSPHASHAAPPDLAALAREWVRRATGELSAGTRARSV